MSGLEAKKYTEGVIFTYSISHLAQKDKVRFFYALSGRYSDPGLVRRYGLQVLGRAVWIAPMKHEQVVEKFLKDWGCSYLKRYAKVAGLHDGFNKKSGHEAGHKEVAA